MSYSITPNFFSIKYPGAFFDESKKAHRMCYEKCNFRCGYCDFANRKKNNHTFDRPQFEKMISFLQSLSPYYKFTGGEITLNPTLNNDLSIVKEQSGIVFLDTNGSNPRKIEELISQALIDVIGISLKGYDKITAEHNANISNPELCWHNVIRTIQLANDSFCKTVVTVVLHTRTPLSDLQKYAELLSPYKNIVLKINNLIPCSFQGKEEYTPYEPEHFIKTIEGMLESYPIWKNRIVIIPNSGAMTNHNHVVYI